MLPTDTNPSNEYEGIESSSGVKIVQTEKWLVSAVNTPF